MSNQQLEDLSSEEVISSIDEIMGSPDNSVKRIEFYDSYSGSRQETENPPCPLSTNLSVAHLKTLELVGISASAAKPASESADSSCPLASGVGPTLSETLELVSEGPKPNRSIPKLMELQLDPRIWRREVGEPQKLQEGPPGRVYLRRSFRTHCWNCDEPGHERHDCS